MLWRILDRIFDLGLRYENTAGAIAERKAFLRERNIGVCDIVASARRAKIDASDLGMADVRLRNLVHYLWQYPRVETLLFTGGNSRNGPEYFFRKQLKEYGERLVRLNEESPRIHEFRLPMPGKEGKPSDRVITTVSLIAPTGTANRAIGSMMEYKIAKQKNPEFTPLDFRVEQYRKFF